MNIDEIECTPKQAKAYNDYLFQCVDRVYLRTLKMTITGYRGLGMAETSIKMADLVNERLKKVETK